MPQRIKSLRLALEMPDGNLKYKGEDNFYLRDTQNGFSLGIQERSQFPDATMEVLKLETGIMHNIKVWNR